MSATIQIVSFRPGWAIAYQALAATLRKSAGYNLRLHHIGSTAVPGLPAKDVIDIQLTVTDLHGFDETPCLANGFGRVPVLADHCPAGLELAASDLAKRFYRNVESKAHLHVREDGRFNQRYPLVCRDYLRSHPMAAQAYVVIKQRLAVRCYDDVAAYYDIKDPVFDLIMAGANEWAAATGWREPPAD